MPMEFASEEMLQALEGLFRRSTRVALIGHTHPDGDALGCTGALAAYLRENRGIGAACLFPDSPAAHLRFIVPEGVPLLCQDTDPEASARWIQSADLIVLLDANAFSRTEGLAPLLAASPAPKVLIDHHLNPDREAFQLAFSTPDISSASELLYWLLKGLEGEASRLCEGCRKALLAGMTTDTNNFANSVFPSTFRMASELIAAGTDRDALLGQLYCQYRPNRVRLMGYMQNEGLQLLPCGAAYMVLTQEIQQRFDLKEGESEGLVNVPLSIGSVRLSVLVKEENGVFRVSVRSKKGTSAQRLAQTFFHGGGHENAAGGKILIGEDIPRPEAVSAYLEQTLNAFLS